MNPLVCLSAIAICLAADSSLHAQQSAPHADSLFGLRSFCEVHIRLSAEEWEKLQPPKGTSFDIGRALPGVVSDATAGRNFHSEKSSRPGLAGYLGIDHQYGKGSVTIDGETVADVGVRYKGNGTFLTGFPEGKPSFKIDFNEYKQGQEFRGLRKLNLNNKTTDSSFLREALSYELFREAGIPSPRVGWGRVSVTVGDGKAKQLGLYTIVEQVDKQFLKRMYGSADGLLLKPSTFGTFRYFGEEWGEYDAAYNPKTDPSPEQQERLIAFAKLVNLADDDEFQSRVEEFLDMDQFFTFLSINVLLSNMDSFLGGSQNYYAYLEPSSNRFQLCPWDLDLSFGAFGMLGTPESRRDSSVDNPQIGEGSNRLIERVLAVPRFRDGYHDRIRSLASGVFGENKVRGQIDEAGQFVRELLEPHQRARFDAAMGDRPTPSEPHVLKYFVTKRLESVQEQLAGRSSGQRHSFNTLPPGNPAQWIKIAAVLVLTLALNVFAWIWGMIAGFRTSNGWGLANMVFYPVAPVIYGFGVRRKSGIAIGAVVAFLALVAVVIGSAMSLR